MAWKIRQIDRCGIYGSGKDIQRISGRAGSGAGGCGVYLSESAGKGHFLQVSVFLWRKSMAGYRIPVWFRETVRRIHQSRLWCRFYRRLYRNVQRRRTGHGAPCRLRLFFLSGAGYGSGREVHLRECYINFLISKRYW